MLGKGEEEESIRMQEEESIGCKKLLMTLGSQAPSTHLLLKNSPHHKHILALFSNALFPFSF